MNGLRRRGMPRGRWIDSVTKDPRRVNVTNWKRIAEDRKRWRGIVAQVLIHNCNAEKEEEEEEFCCDYGVVCSVGCQRILDIF